MSSKSTDPNVVTHPDGSQTFTPGMKGRKLASMLVGLAIALFGVFWQWESARLLLFGETVDATVAYVMEVKLGQEPVKLDSRKAVAEAEDPTRNATYYYHMRFETASGETVTSRLNYGQALRPIHSIGDSITVSYDASQPTVLIDQWSVRTWAFGFFFIGIGLLIFVTQLLLYLTADRAILLDTIGDFSELEAEPEGPDGKAKPSP